MYYVSTFFSYSSKDERLVHAVADELCQLGVLVWLDKNELEPRGNLTPILDKAIREQSSVTLFVSKAALASAWVNQELRTVLELEKIAGYKERIIPVFLDDPLELVRSHELLRGDWLHSHGDRVDRHGIIPESKKKLSEKAKGIAKQIATGIYSISKVSEQKNIILYIDQRGDHKRRGRPSEIPPNVQRIDGPIMVFRPNHDVASRGELIQAQAWEMLRDNYSWALATALKGVRWESFKEIHISGNAQLVVPFISGQIFDRSSSAHLYCHGRNGPFENSKQPRNSPLAGGNPNCEWIEPSVGLNPIPITSLNKIALVLAKENYLKDVQRYLGANPNSPPLVMVKSGDFNNNEDVMKYIIDVVALLLRLRNDNGVRAIDLFCSLPFHAIPILAANLLYVVDNITFMEYDRSATQIEKMYVPLPTIARK